MLVSELLEDSQGWDESKFADLAKELKSTDGIRSVDAHGNNINFRRLHDVFTAKLISNGRVELFVMDPMGKLLKIRPSVKSAVDVVRAAIFINDHGYHHKLKETIGKGTWVKTRPESRTRLAGVVTQIDGDLAWVAPHNAPNKPVQIKISNLTEAKNPKLTFDATGDHEDTESEVWIRVMCNHPQDDYYDDYAGVNVIFSKKSKKISGVTGDAKAATEWRNHKNEIIAAAKKFADKHNLLKT